MFSQGEEEVELEGASGAIADYNDMDVPFVGRLDRLEELKIKITHKSERRRLIQIYGPPMVGKKRLAKQVRLELLQEAKDKGFTNFVAPPPLSLRELNSLESTKLQLSVIFDMPVGKPANFLESLRQHLNASDTAYLILFDNCESVCEDSDLQDKFMNLVEDLIRASPNITVMLTSIRVLNFIRLDENKMWKIENLEPLDENDAKRLLLNVTNKVVMTDEMCLEICTLCYRYPFMLIFVGRILNLREYEPDEIVTVLKTCTVGDLEHDAHAKSDKPSVTLYNQLRPLSEILKKTASRLAYFPQSFDQKAAKYVGGFTNIIDTKKALISLKNRSITEFDSDKRRFTMATPFRDILKNEVVEIREIKETRRLFSQYFGEMLVKVNLDLDKRHPQKVLREMVDDWPNIEHLLKEAVNCSDEQAYGIYIKIARKAERAIGKYMPQTGITFFQSLLEFAQEYGITEDIPMLMSNMAIAMSNTTNIGSKEVLRHMKKAYRMMMEAGRPTYHLRMIIQNMGWLYYRMGKTNKSLSLLKQGLNMRVDDINEKEDRRNYNLTVKISHQLALSHTAHREYEESNAIVERMVPEARETSPYHPSINGMTNTMGLNKEGLNVPGGGLEKFQESLRERRKHENKYSLVGPLNNIANALLRQHKYDECMKYLFESEQVQIDQRKGGANTIVSKRQIGLCYFMKGDIEKALQYFTKALEILTKFYPKHYEIPEAKMAMAFCCKELGRHNEVIDMCLNVLHTATDYYLTKASTVHLSLKMALTFLNELLEDSPQKESYQIQFEDKFHEIAKIYREADEPSMAIEIKNYAVYSQMARIDDINAARKLLSDDHPGKKVSFNMQPTCYSLSDTSESYTSSYKPGFVQEDRYQPTTDGYVPSILSSLVNSCTRIRHDTSLQTDKPVFTGQNILSEDVSAQPNVYKHKDIPQSLAENTNVIYSTLNSYKPLDVNPLSKQKTNITVSQNAFTMTPQNNSTPHTNSTQHTYSTWTPPTYSKPSPEQPDITNYNTPKNKPPPQNMKRPPNTSDASIPQNIDNHIPTPPEHYEYIQTAQKQLDHTVPHNIPLPHNYAQPQIIGHAQLPPNYAPTEINRPPNYVPTQINPPPNYAQTSVSCEHYHDLMKTDAYKLQQMYDSSHSAESHNKSTNNNHEPSYDSTVPGRYTPPDRYTPPNIYTPPQTYNPPQTYTPPHTYTPQNIYKPHIYAASHTCTPPDSYTLPQSYTPQESSTPPQSYTPPNSYSPTPPEMYKPILLQNGIGPDKPDNTTPPPDTNNTIQDTGRHTSPDSYSPTPPELYKPFLPQNYTQPDKPDNNSTAYTNNTQDRYTCTPPKSYSPTPPSMYKPMLPPATSQPVHTTSQPDTNPPHNITQPDPHAPTTDYNPTLPNLYKLILPQGYSHTELDSSSASQPDINTSNNITKPEGYISPPPMFKSYNYPQFNTPSADMFTTLGSEYNYTESDSYTSSEPPPPDNFNLTSPDDCSPAQTQSFTIPDNYSTYSYTHEVYTHYTTQHSYISPISYTTSQSYMAGENLSENYKQIDHVKNSGYVNEKFDIKAFSDKSEDERKIDEPHHQQGKYCEHDRTGGHTIEGSRIIFPNNQASAANPDTNTNFVSRGQSKQMRMENNIRDLKSVPSFSDNEDDHAESSDFNEGNNTQGQENNFHKSPAQGQENNFHKSPKVVKYPPLFVRRADGARERGTSECDNTKYNEL